MKYLATITLAIATTAHAQLSDDPSEALRRQREQLDEIQRQTERVNAQLRDEREVRFRDAFRRSDLQGMTDNLPR